MGCPSEYDKVSVHETTNSYSVIVDLKYGPPNPIPGCDMEWFINFMRVVNPTEFVNQVHYDIWVVDESDADTCVPTGVKKIVTETLMTTIKDREKLAQNVLAAVQ